METFAVTVEANLLPGFTTTVLPRRHLLNQAVDQELPRPTVGNRIPTFVAEPALLAGLTYTPPADPTATGGLIAGTPAAEAITIYTLMGTRRSCRSRFK